MADYTAKRIDEMEAIQGRFRRVRGELGVSSFGINVIDMPADWDGYPEHAEPDQEEVYMALSGSGEIEVAGERHAMGPSQMIRVAAGTRRKIWPGPEGMRLLALGGIPGQAYEPPDFAKVASAPERSADATSKRIEEMETLYRGSMYKARAELGVSSFGLQVIDFPPNAHRYPEHAHAESGQEEVYLVLSGAAEIEVDGEMVPLPEATMIRVGPGARRKIRTADSPARVVAVGGVPGQPFEPARFTELGEPDPLAG